VIIVVDSTALCLLVNPSANPPDDPNTGRPVVQARDRIERMISELGANGTLIIPTPVLAEVLVRAEAGASAIVAELERLSRVRVRPFDQRAAIETAIMTGEAIRAGDKRGGSTDAWQKVKVDRQIIAIARTNNATRIYADDKALVAFARRLGMDVVSTWELALPETEENLFTANGLRPDGSDDCLADDAIGEMS
jgi:predicted nucleic acid-binding protein